MVVSVTAQWHGAAAVIGSPLKKGEGVPANVYWAVDNKGPVDGFVQMYLNDLTTNQPRFMISQVLRVPAKAGIGILLDAVVLPVGEHDISIVVNEVNQSGAFLKGIKTEQFHISVLARGAGGPMLSVIGDPRIS